MLVPSSMDRVDFRYRNSCILGDVLHGFDLGRTTWSLDDAMPTDSHYAGSEGLVELSAQPKPELQWKQGSNRLTHRLEMNVDN